MVVLLVAKLAPGTVGTIARGMLRESISAQTAAVAIAVIGLNIHFGYTGLLNMGQAGFMMLGAYGFSISHLARPADGRGHPDGLRWRRSCSR